MTFIPVGLRSPDFEGVPIQLIARVMRAVCEGERERCDHKNYIQDREGYFVPQAIWRPFRREQMWGHDTGHRHVQGIPLVLTEYRNLMTLNHFNGSWRFIAKLGHADRYDTKNTLYLPSNQGDMIVDDARVFAAYFASAEIHNTNRFRHDMTIMRMFYGEV